MKTIPLICLALAASIALIVSGMVGCNGGKEGDGVTATPVMPEPTSPATITFHETGTLIRDNPGLPPGIWFLLYEEPGAPALTVELRFTKETECRSEGETTPCSALRVGDRVRIDGKESDHAVEVVTLEAERASVPSREITIQVFFLDEQRFATGQQPFVVPVERQVNTPAVARGSLEALFQGPTTDKGSRSLRFVRSGATGARLSRLEDGIAHVQLIGGCDSMGSTFTVAQEIIPTLTQFETIDFVKIYDPTGTTADPQGPSNSIPACLEP